MRGFSALSLCLAIPAEGGQDHPQQTARAHLGVAAQLVLACGWQKPNSNVRTKWQFSISR
jgi:hypothetical protein